MASINLAELLHEKAADVTPPVVEPKINAYEAVRQCLSEIRGCRKRKLSWDAIAELVKSVVLEGYGIELSLTGETTRHYYYKLTRKKRSNRGAKSSKTTRQAQQPSAQPLPLLPEEPQEAESVEELTPVAPAEANTSPEHQPAEPTGETFIQDSEDSSQSDRYQRPPGSRFTKGYKVKHWNGGSS